MLPQIRRRTVASVPDWPGIPPLLARILAGRGVSAPAQTDLSLKQLPPPDTLPGIADAVDLLLALRERAGRILIVGDYDADGATATSLMLRGLPMLGFEMPGFLVPDRFVFGYGLSPAIVDLAVAQGAPDLIITVDNGIASVDGVAAARAAGIAVVITDHHLPGAELPAADAIVNPRLQADGAGHNLAGVGVAFYLLLALRAALRDKGDEAGKAPLADLLDLVALGTVADVVPLDQVNRALVEQGLRRIRAGQCVPGITALLEVGRRDPARAVAADLGFAVGPRLNAAGRLDDMALGINCLLCDDAERALTLATELDTINRERRGIEQGMRDAAMAYVHALRERSSILPKALCLHDALWHEGVVGILASRVKEATHRPVVAFAPAQEAGLLKGSGRSIPGLHLRDVLDRVATANPGLLHRFGGHAMAAGMTLATERLDDFTRAFAQAVDEMAEPGLFDEVLETDGALADDELHIRHAELLSHAFPWGQGFPAPSFDGEFEVIEHRIVGERHLKLTLGLPATGGIIDGIHFNVDLATLPKPLRRVRGVYRLEVNVWQGRRSPQLIFQHLEGLAR
ncbi:single-stranded-DNA-specific exonuclease RecJ [Alcanivorax sp. JB21]|uniref:single-stranded-DNA-specific exonuclease RecJ n=1 Tax=Alcanivorax limicola TaxID=2874102 RepID=UPI001CBBD5CF|nr:single-stranded-DNA-specific exonuclease RecJ [Alcanivorax limicola]MBZ2188473.1 single-stranded-DNA-specific exonuclease RecJ [Alcanivorax limicola]